MKLATTIAAAVIVAGATAISATIVAAPPPYIDPVDYFATATDTNGDTLALSDKYCVSMPGDSRGQKSAAIWRFSFTKGSVMEGACWGEWPGDPDLINFCTQGQCRPVQKSIFKRIQP